MSISHTPADKESAPDQSGEGRSWFIDTFAAASQLESRLIPDVLDGKEGGFRKAIFPTVFTEKQLQALQKHFSCSGETLLETAFGLTLSTWSADTKACFSSVREGLPEHPVFLEWTPDQTLSSLLDKTGRQAEAVRTHADIPFAELAAELELDRGILFGGPACPETPDLPDGAVAAFYWEAGRMTVHYRADRYTEGILKQFTDSFHACLLSMMKAATVSDLAFASEEQLAEVEGFNPPPVSFDPECTLLDLFREHVRRQPDRPAVVYKGVLLTYGQLDALSDNLAAYIAGTVPPGGVPRSSPSRTPWTCCPPGYASSSRTARCCCPI